MEIENIDAERVLQLGQLRQKSMDNGCLRYRFQGNFW